MEIDLNQIINGLLVGGGIYAGIRVELKFLWKFHDKLDKRLEKLEDVF